MTYEQHLGWGVAAYFLAIIPISAWIMYRQGSPGIELWHYWWEILVCFVLCVLAAIFPDIDIKSKSQKIIYSIVIATDVTLILFRYYRPAAIIGFFAMLPNVLKHRGQLHSPLAALILPIPLLIVPILVTGNLGFQQLGVPYYIAAMFGYMSHIIADRKG